MKLAYAYHLDANSPNVQSSRPYSILTHLQNKGMAVEEIFPLAETGKLDRFIRKVWSKTTRQEYLYDRQKKLLLSFSRQIEARLKNIEVDFVFSPSTLPISYLRTNLPVIFCADAPFSAMRNYYPSFSRLSKSQIAFSEKLEKRVLQKCALAIYPSTWAANSAIQNYNVDPSKVAVIPFGANIGWENTIETVSAAIEQRPRDIIRLLFVGKEWERKGGPLVLQTADWLAKKGLQVEVDIIGCIPPSTGAGKLVIRLHNQINSATIEGKEDLRRLFLNTHFLFVPSQAEAYGMVFCEANAAGVPAISFDTGGISEIIKNGINGFKLPSQANFEDFGKVILETSQDRETYRVIAHSSYEEFKTRLNWNTFADIFIEKVAQACQIAPPCLDNIPSKEVIELDTKGKSFRIALIYDKYLDPRNRSSWSGLPYYILASFKKQKIEIIHLPLLENKGRLRRRLNFLFHHFIRHELYLKDRDPSLLKNYARQIEAALPNLQVDVAFCLGSSPFTYVKTATPMVFWTDATFRGVSHFYASFSKLVPRSIEEGLAAEKLALKNVNLAIFASDWAAETAVSVFDALPERVKVIPFGANLDLVPDEETIKKTIRRRSQTICKILFSGVDWIRKGADKAVEVAEALHLMGISVQLTIIGCNAPEKTVLPPFVHVKGFISKSTVEGRKTIGNLLEEAHFFLLPSRAEAFGVVFCEASAMGIPCLATTVGGIASAVRDGINGQLFDIADDGDVFARYIAQLWQNREAYEALALSSSREYRQRLNWDASTKRVLKYMRELTGQTGDASLARIPEFPAQKNRASSNGVYQPISINGRPIRAAYVVNNFLDPGNSKSWSGLPYNIKKSLEMAGIEFVPGRPLIERGGKWRMFRFIIWRFLARKRFLRHSDTAYLKDLARQSAEDIRSSHADIVFAPSTWSIAYLDTHLPIVFWTDATFRSVLGFYKSFENLAPPSLRDADAAEHAALKRCSRAIYSSDWAADSAKKDYFIPDDKLAVVPFGANMDSLPSFAQVEKYISIRPFDSCELLLVGVEWERKGVAIAIDTLVALKKLGSKARLTIVGCAVPEGTTIPTDVEIIAFIDKKSPEGQKRLHEIFARTHFFLMPTRADCTPVVYSEANSFGIPCLTTNVGGIPTIIRNGMNGQLFPLKAGGPDYAQAIFQIMQSPEEYRALAIRSRNEAEERLSWDVAGRRVAEILKEVILENARKKEPVPTV